MLKNGLIEGKVHMKDIKEGTHPREMPVLIVGKQKFWASATTKDMLATHDDCAKCNKEFEKRYSNSRYCSECEFQIQYEKYVALPFKEWNGSDPVFSRTLDQYFFGSDEIDDYLNDNEVEEDINLMLVLCTSNYASQLDYDHFCDDLPEDGEPPEALKQAMIEFNKKIMELSPLSWSEGKIRTSYTHTKD